MTDVHIVTLNGVEYDVDDPTSQLQLYIDINNARASILGDIADLRERVATVVGALHALGDDNDEAAREVAQLLRRTADAMEGRAEPDPPSDT